MTNERTTFLSFLLPFLLGGAYFAVVAVRQMRQLPSELNGSMDYFYAIVLAFQDMGLACGISGLLVLAIMRKVAPGFAKIRGNIKRE